MKEKERKYISDIAAYVLVSEAELFHVNPEYSVNWFYDELQKKKLDKLLHSFGMDTQYKYDLQEVTQHRSNLLGKVCTCRRYFGYERQDLEWINSGYASREALDKFKSNRLVDEMYFQKGLTHQAQVSAELKDQYRAGEEVEFEGTEGNTNNDFDSNEGEGN